MYLSRIRKPLSRFPRHRRGGVVIEMALTLGVLMTLTFGAIEFTYCFFIKHALTNAATQGGWAAVLSGSTNSDVQAAVDAQMSAAKLTNVGYTITTSPTDISTAAAGTTVTVQVSCVWGNAGKGFRPLGLISADKVVSATTAMRKEPG